MAKTSQTRKRDPGGWNAYDDYFRSAHMECSERTNRLLNRAAMAGNAIAIRVLAQSPERDAAALAAQELRDFWLNTLKGAAECGNPLAQRELGIYYLYQKPPRLAEARQWLSRAADNGDPGAFHALHKQLPAYGPPRSPRERASRHRSGERYRLAIPLLEYCAARGDTEAQAELTFLYRERQRGMRPNLQRRRYWKRRLIAAARQGNVWAQQYLGFSYLFGDGVRQNLRRARYWLLCAAGNGDAEVQINLHCWGATLRLSEAEAQAWQDKAAANGDSSALWEKGCKALGPKGKTTETALRLIREAARNGCPPAIEWYDRWRDREGGFKKKATRGKGQKPRRAPARTQARRPAQMRLGPKPP